METQHPARKPYRRGEGGKLRADILAAAAALIEETGSEQSVTLREIARRIGIAAPSIYEHFPSREAIVYAVIDDLASQLRAAVAQAQDSQPDPLGRLRAYHRQRAQRVMGRPRWITGGAAETTPDEHADDPCRLTGALDAGAADIFARSAGSCS